MGMCGLIHRISKQLLVDVYANSFRPNNTICYHQIITADEMEGSGKTRKFHSKWTTPCHSGEVFERKFEVDSLPAFLKLSYLYWNSTGDTECFDGDWRDSVKTLLDTLKIQQKGSLEEIDNPAYTSLSTTDNSYNMLPEAGRGPTAKR